MSRRGMVIAGADQWSRLWATLLSLPPPSWLKVLRGPALVVVIGEDGAIVAEDRQWWRPIHVLLQPDLILSKRVTLPMSARADLGSAVEVMVVTATPFALAELLVHVQELDRGNRTDEIACHVQMTPRDRIVEALASLGLPAWRVTTIVPLEAAPGQIMPDFSGAFSWVTRVLRLTPFLPLVALAIGLLTLSQTHLGGLRSENAALELAVADREIAVRSSLSDLAERQEALAAKVSIDQAFAETPSVFLLLEQIRANLPPEVAINRLLVDGATLRLDIRAPEVLQLLRGLATAMPDWSVSVEGSISRSPDGAAELATLLLQWSLR